MDFEELVSSRKDRLLRKKVLVTGDYNIVPFEDAKCKISLTEISIIDDKGTSEIEQDSQYFRADFNGQIIIGESDNFIDKDVELLVQQMCKYEVCLAQIVYKRDEENISKQITFRLELLDMTEEDLVSDWDWQRLLKMSLHHKDCGVELVKKKNIIEAFRRFSKAFKFIVAIEPIDTDAITENQITEITSNKIKLYNNMALCQLHFNGYEATLELCNKVLQLEADNVKALYRRSCAHAGLKMFEEAWNDIQAAIALDPSDKATQQKALTLKPIINKINTDYTNVVKKMFG